MNSENRLIIEQLNKFGRVPQTYELLQMIEQMEQENKQLKDNWNELREIIRKKQDHYRHFKDNRYRTFLSELLDKMQEIEQGSDNNGQ